MDETSNKQQRAKLEHKQRKVIGSNKTTTVFDNTTTEIRKTKEKQQSWSNHITDLIWSLEITHK